MSRRTRAVKREVQADSRFESATATKFINALMLDGKKSLAEKIFYDALDIVEEKSGQPGLNVFRTALTNATYHVPIEVRPERRNALAIRWLIGYARQRGEKNMAQRLAAEFMAASRGEGSTVKKKEDTHRMAEANKAFAHYRW